MIFVLITTFVFLAVILGAAFIFIWNYSKKRRQSGKKPIHMAIPAVMLAAGVIGMALIPGSFHTVNAGEVAVVKRMGVITNVEQPGTYFDFWAVNQYEIYDAKVQQISITDDAYTADAQSMQISMVVQFQIRQDNVKEIALNYGGLQSLTNLIQSVALERTKSALSQYAAEKLIEERNSLSPLVETVVEEAIGEKYYVTFKSAVLTDITFSDAFEAAVEAKMMAQQEKLQAEYENEKKKEQADTELYIAEQQAKALVAKAKAEADAKIEEATAEARSIMLKSVEIARMLGYEINEIQNEITAEDGTVITEITYEIVFDEQHTGADIAEYLKYIEYLSKWNGELPKVWTGEGGFMITVPADGAASEG